MWGHVRQLRNDTPANSHTVTVDVMGGGGGRWEGAGGISAKGTYSYIWSVMQQQCRRYIWGVVRGLGAAQERLLGWLGCVGAYGAAEE